MSDQLSFSLNEFQVPLPLELFGVRAQNVIKRLEIDTVKDFLTVDWLTIECRQLGNKTRDELALMQQEIKLNGHAAIHAAIETATNSSKIHSTLPLLQLPEEWKSLPVPVSDLSVRATGVLERSNIETLETFLQTSFQGLECFQLGLTTREELHLYQQKWHEAVKAALFSDAATNLELFQLLQRGSEIQNSTLPDDNELVWTNDGILNLPRIWSNVVRTIVQGDRTYDILARRFALDGHNFYSLEQLGTGFGVSRERIRQIEKSALKRLYYFITDGKVHGLQQKAHPAFLEEVAHLKHLVQQQGFPLSDESLGNVLRIRYSSEINGVGKSFLNLLWEIFGWARYSLEPPEVFRQVLDFWIGDQESGTQLVLVVNATQRHLAESASPVALFDLLIAANKALKTENLPPTTSAALRRLLPLSSDCQVTGEDIFQCRFNNLTSNVLRVERVMREWAQTGKTVASSQEICQEVNHRLAMDNATPRSASSLVNACGASLALTSIGKSGGWTLTENAGETRTIHEIIFEALRVFNRPATYNEIFDYVKTRRSTTWASIAGTIAQHRKFQNVGRGLFALREWGLEDAPQKLKGEGFHQQFEETLMEIFIEHNVEPIPVAQLLNELRIRLNWPESSLRERVESSSWLDFTRLSSTRWQAHWRNEPKIIAPNEQIERNTKRGRIQKIARRLLANAPEQQMEGGKLAARIEIETNYVRAMIYNALAAMPDVERNGAPRNMIYRIRK